MRKRIWIPKSVIEKYYDEVYFIVDTYFIYAQAVLLRVGWSRPMPYKVNVDEVNTIVTILLVEDMDVSVKKFGTYETIIVELTIESSTTKVGKQRNQPY